LVLTAFLQDAPAGELGELRSRHDVWRMLAKRTRLRAINLVRDEKRLRRGQVGESVFRDAQGVCDPLGIQHQPDNASHDVDALHQELLTLLSDPLEHRIATLLLDGKEIPQIAELTEKSTATIYRKISRIKECWLSPKPS
ncbi:MAG: ECF-type sigma factor, partial [Pirellulaceae bacterium]